MSEKPSYDLIGELSSRYVQGQIGSLHFRILLANPEAVLRLGSGEDVDEVVTLPDGDDQLPIEWWCDVVQMYGRGGLTDSHFRVLFDRPDDVLGLFQDEEYESVDVDEFEEVFLDDDGVEPDEREDRYSIIVEATDADPNDPMLEGLLDEPWTED